MGTLNVVFLGIFTSVSVWAGASGPGHQHSTSLSGDSTGSSFAQGQAPPSLPNGFNGPIFSPPPPLEPVRLSAASAVSGKPPEDSRTRKVGKPGESPIRRNVSSVYEEGASGASEVRTVIPRARRATRLSGQN